MDRVLVSKIAMIKVSIPCTSRLDLVLKQFLGMANAAARGHGSAYAAAGAEERSLKGRERGVGQEASQGKKVAGRVDHLGIEA
jgi:hypothetical protein